MKIAQRRYSLWGPFCKWEILNSFSSSPFLHRIHLQSKNDIDGALNKYKLIDEDGQKGSEIWSNVGLCFFKKKKFIAVSQSTYHGIFRSITNFGVFAGDIVLKKVGVVGADQL